MVEQEAEREVVTIQQEGEHWGDALTVAPAVGPGTTDPPAVYLASVRPAGRAALVRALRVVARLLKAEYETFPWRELRYQHVAAIRSRLQERGAAPATVNLTLAAFRGIARYAKNLGLLSAEDYERIREVKAARGERPPAGRSATGRRSRRRCWCAAARGTRRGWCRWPAGRPPHWPTGSSSVATGRGGCSCQSTRAASWSASG